MKKCEVCGGEFTPNSNRQKYCADCKKIIIKKQRIDALNKYYKKKLKL